MRRRAVFAWMAVIGLLGAAMRPACAYYDDVHYALTYYVARQVGFTPEQAYRIASADLSVDYSETTEPVHGNFDPFPVSCHNQEPRWKFHAFRNECEYPQSVFPLDGQGPLADQAIKEQQVKLYVAGLTAKNPGVYLHFYQDEVPHAAYGSAAGHWLPVGFGTLDPLLLGNLASARPVGGTTDWLAYREERQPGSNLKLAGDTASTLSAVMVQVSPAQRGVSPPYSKPRPLPTTGEIARVLEALRQSNRPAYPAQLFPIDLPAFASAYLTAKEKRTPEQLARFGQHLDGPDLKAAVAIINDAMNRAGMVESLARGGKGLPDYVAAAHQYLFDGDGKLIDLNPPDRFPPIDPRDQFVLTGSLKVKVAREDSVTGKPAPVSQTNPAGVTIKAPPTMDGEQEYPLSSVTLTEGQTLEFKDLPIGKVIVEVTDNSGRRVRQEVMLDKQENEATVTLTRLFDWSGRWNVWFIPQPAGKAAGTITFHKATEQEVRDLAKSQFRNSLNYQCPPGQDAVYYTGEYDYGGSKGKIVGCSSSRLQGQDLQGRYSDTAALGSTSGTGQGIFLMLTSDRKVFGGAYRPDELPLSATSYFWSGEYIGP